jgi:hypothetical protein
MKFHFALLLNLILLFPQLGLSEVINFDRNFPTLTKTVCTGLTPEQELQGLQMIIEHAIDEFSVNHEDVFGLGRLGNICRRYDSRYQLCTDYHEEMSASIVHQLRDIQCYFQHYYICSLVRPFPQHIYFGICTLDDPTEVVGWYDPWAGIVDFQPGTRSSGHSIILWTQEFRDPEKSVRQLD